jgi:hypothetical protein
MARTSNLPRWYLIPVRAGLLTLICTLLCFLVALLAGIIGTVLVSAFRHVHPDMRVAYRHVALPAALVSGAIILVLSLAMEITASRKPSPLSPK